MTSAARLGNGLPLCAHLIHYNACMWWRLLLFALTTGGYVTLRAIVPLRRNWWWKAGLILLISPLALRFQVLSLLEGEVPFAPRIPLPLHYVYSALFIAFLGFFCYLFVWQLLRDLVLKHLDAWKKRGDEWQHVYTQRQHFVVIILSILLSALGVWGGLQPPSVREVDIPFPSQHALRIVLLSDLHVSVLRDAAFLDSVVERTNALQPDLIVITGDFVDGSVLSSGARMKALSRLRAPLGVYGVVGNHDYYSDYDEWRSFLNENGVRMLDNCHVPLPGTDIILAGITEESSEKIAGMEQPNLEKALSGIPAAAPIILLSHRPNGAPQADAHGVDLQLSGHTHGGLVWLIGSPVALMNGGYLRGLYHEGGIYRYVSSGTGSGMRTPLRLGIPAEITLIRLTPSFSDSVCR